MAKKKSVGGATKTKPKKKPKRPKTPKRPPSRSY